EDGGQCRHASKDPGQAAAAGGARLHGDREYLDADRLRNNAMVLAAEYPLPLVGAGRDRARCFRGMALAPPERDGLPFLAAIAVFLLGHLGLLISNFPYLIPPSLTIWQTAAAPATHVFFLMGTLVMLPIILGYMIFVYWVFSGKLREGEGYH